MISWQFSIILQLLCIVIAVFIFLITTIRVIEKLKFRSKIKISKRLR